MSIAAAMIKRFGKQYKVIRASKEGDYVQGRWVPTKNTSTVTITASVQPIDGDMLQILPEGERSMEMRTLYTTTKLNTVKETGLKVPDVVCIDGGEWEVHRVEQWQPLLDHYKCLIVRMNRQE